MNMIDAKFGMKYPFPHTMTHIIDNSAYNGTLPVIVADDPSLFATLVVGAFPMGEDGKVIRIDRSDILRVGYGLNAITQADRDKYGQVVDYPMSLLSQGAPVQLLRVTPDDATYAFTTILVSYKWVDDPTNESIFHVKFETSTEIPAGTVLSNFKNPNRLAQAIFNNYAKSSPTADGWTQRAFAVIVSAGRGSTYNNMRMAINTVAQGKRPSNTRYSFSTIDSRTSSVIEEFVASLVNIDNPNIDTYTETVNNIVNQREKGGSVLKPFINEKAVAEVFEAYKKAYKEMLDTGAYISDSFVTNTYKTLDINTFDMITGKYIRDGGLDTYLPFYQVDAEDPDIPKLPASNILINTKTEYDTNPDGVLENLMLDAAYGISHNGMSIYIGDVYLNGSGSKYANPRITIVCGINQYTQAVTAVSYDSIHPLDATASSSNGVDLTTVTPIKKIYQAEPTVGDAIADKFEVGEVYAVIKSSSNGSAGFGLYTITTVTKDEAGSVTAFTSTEYTQSQIISAIPYSTKPGIENLISLIENNSWVETVSKNKNSIGYTVIDVTNGKVYVNDYSVSEDQTFPDGRIEINDNSLKFGNVPSTAGTASDVVGQKYDIMTYADDAITKWAITSTKTIPPSQQNSGYNIGDRLETTEVYTLTTAEPTDWATTYTSYFTFNSEPGVNYGYHEVTGESAPEWTVDTYYKKTDDVALVFTITGMSDLGQVTEVTPVRNNSSTSPVKVTGMVYLHDANPPEGGARSDISVTFTDADNTPYAVDTTATPYEITRYVITGIMGSLYKITLDGVNIPDDYYSPTYGINLSSTFGGVALDLGSAGFLDDNTINPIVFKYKYSELLVKAFRGKIDPSIISGVRVAAKYLFDAGFNTVVGSSFITPMNHSVSDWINGSVIFTDDEKDEILFYPDQINGLVPADIDVKQAMYDLMIERVYDGIPEDRRPIGPGSGFQVLFDSCTTDGATALAINRSFSTRFTNPNASWDIGGMTTPTGYTYTFVKRSVDNLVRHCKTYSVNKPFTGDYTTIAPTEYVSMFPDVDADDWDYRELMWNSGGNAWLPDSNGYVKRMSQRTFYGEETSDLIWESNMRTLSQLTYLLRQKIEHYLFEYSDDSTLKTMKTECDTMFSNWVGDLVDELEINFERGLNTDGGDIVICRVKVVFRGLIIRVPIIVNVERRNS